MIPNFPNFFPETFLSEFSIRRKTAQSFQIRALIGMNPIIRTSHKMRSLVPM